MKASILATIAVLILAVPAAAANIVLNPGFETGDFTSWTTSGNDAAFVGVDNVNPHSGTYGAFFGPQVAPAFLSQDLATNAGGAYELSFWLLNEALGDNFFSLSWDGAEIFSLNSADAFGYQLFEVTGLTATTANTTLQFSFLHEPSFWDLDDVFAEEVPVNAVPEPSTFGLLLVGALGLAAVRRFRASA